MRTPTRSIAFAAVLCTLASIAQAHPGHDGDHEFTWDFRHLVAHPGATLLWLGIVGVGLYFSYRLSRSASQPRRRQ